MIDRWVSRRFLVITAGLVVAGVAGFFLARAMIAPEVIAVPLPPKVLRVHEVPEVTRAAPGEPRVIERIRWRTEPAPIPQATIETLSEWAARERRELEAIARGDAVVDDGPAEPAEVRVQIEADQFAGNDEGKTIRGWRGWASCQIRFGDSWQELARAPLDLEASEATAVPFIPPRPKLGRLDIGAAFTGDGLGLSVGYFRRLSWRTRAGQAVLPTWLGVQVLGSFDGNPAAVVSAGWELD